MTEVLNEVHVKKGDTFFVKAGTIHAIGSGILICEIQQNSNCTYRLYDYGRKDKFGNLRPLHLDKAVAVADMSGVNLKQCEYPSDKFEDYQVRKLCECKYFTSTKYDVMTSTEIFVDDTSFMAVTFLEGTGFISSINETMKFQPADCFFIHAGKKSVEINGACSFILTKL